MCWPRHRVDCVAASSSDPNCAKDASSRYCARTVSYTHLDFLDSSKMFNGTVEPQFRSLMNIPFVTESAELDAEVVAATKAAGYDNLKGHKSVGGLRASVYNAMPIEGAQALVEFLKKFEAEHK